MSAVNSVNLPIDEKAYSYAKIYSAFINDEYQRKRAYASIVALYAFLNILEKTSLNVQKSMTLFRNPILNEQYEISDIYVNNWHLDVRVVNDSNAVLVPKIHFDSGIVPDFYIAVKVDSALKTAELVGIADMSGNINETFDYNYYKIPFTSLISYEEFIQKVTEEKEENFTKKENEIFEDFYLSLMDGGLDLPIKNKVLKHLFNCSDARTEFCCFTGFEMVSCNISKFPDVLDDKTLEIIGAQNLEDSKYKGKEQTIYIGSEELPEETSASGSDSVNSDDEKAVDDILDELFNDEEQEEITNPQKDRLDEIKDNTSDLHEISTNEEIDFIDKNDLSGDILVNDDNANIILNSESNDFEIIEDETSGNKKNEDLQLIDENNSDELNEIKEIDETEDNSDLVVINEEETELAEEYDISKETFSSKEEIQKVIVDYDEYGEPIYSYITNINQEDAGTVLSEVEPSADNVQIQNDETVPCEENLSEDYESENNSEEERMQNDNVQEIPRENESQNCDYKNDDTSNEVSYNSEPDTEAVNLYERQVIQEPCEEKKEYIENTKENATKAEKTGNKKSDSEKEEHPENEQSYNNNEYETNGSEESEDDKEYEEDESDEYDKYENSKSSLKPIVAVISIIVALGLVGGGALLALKGLKNNDKTASLPVENVVQTEDSPVQINDMFEQPVENQGTEVMQDNNPQENTNNNQTQQDNNPAEMPMPQQGTIPVPPPVRPSSNGDVNKAIANAFIPQGTGISLRGLNWFCTAELFTDPSFKNYLQDLDNKLKQNIKNNIMGIIQYPPNDSVGAKFAVDNNGNLQKVIISDSSGSDEIDNIVLQSIKESFEGEKSQILNDSNLKSDMYYLKVVIKL